MDDKQVAVLIPFSGSLWTISLELVAMKVDGSFISPVGTFSDRWRGRCQLQKGKTRPVAPGDSLILKQADGGETDIVVMDVSPEAMGFRCLRTASPVHENDQSSPEIFGDLGRHTPGDRAE